MTIGRLALFLESKYNLGSVANTTYEGKLGAIKKELTNAYNMYCNPAKAVKAYNILPLLAQLGEPHSSQIISLMKDMIDNFDNYSNENLFGQVNGILSLINELQQDGSKKIRNAIHDSFPIQRESDRNRREMAKSKWEQVVNHKLSSILKKQAEKLKELVSSSAPIMGGPVETTRKELSKDKLLMFSHTLAAEYYGFNDLNVLQKLLQYDDTRQMLTTLINAIDRNHIPKDGPEIMAETSEIKRTFERLQNNEPYFEAGEDVAREMARPKFVSPELKKERLEENQQFESDSWKEFLNQDPKTQELIKKRDEEFKQKQIEEDRARHISSEGSALLKALIKKRYL